MTISLASLAESVGSNQQSYATALNSSNSTPYDRPGIVRWEQHPIYGTRGFQYVSFYQSGGVTAGQLVSYYTQTITNITSGTTTSITTSGLVADKLVGGLLRCSDDAGGAGAAPEGEIARIVKNTTTVITIDSDDAFSVAPAVNDDFTVILPWATVDSASGDPACNVAGVAMADNDQYGWGWVQFFGITQADAVAAGTALVVNQGVIAGTALVTASSTSAAGLLLGSNVAGLTSDTVRRKALVRLAVGAASGLTITT